MQVLEEQDVEGIVVIIVLDRVGVGPEDGDGSAVVCTHPGVAVVLVDEVQILELGIVRRQGIVCFRGPLHQKLPGVLAPFAGEQVVKEQGDLWIGIGRTQHAQLLLAVGIETRVGGDHSHGDAIAGINIILGGNYLLGNVYGVSQNLVRVGHVPHGQGAGGEIDSHRVPVLSFHSKLVQVGGDDVVPAGLTVMFHGIEVVGRQGVCLYMEDKALLQPGQQDDLILHNLGQGVLLVLFVNNNDILQIHVVRIRHHVAGGGEGVVADGVAAGVGYDVLGLDGDGLGLCDRYLENVRIAYCRFIILVASKVDKVIV